MSLRGIMCMCVCVCGCVVRPEHYIVRFTVFDCLKIRPFCLCCTKSIVYWANGSKVKSEQRQKTSCYPSKQLQKKTWIWYCIIYIFFLTPWSNKRKSPPLPPKKKAPTYKMVHTAVQLPADNFNGGMIRNRLSSVDPTGGTAAKVAPKNTVLKKSREVRKSMGCWMMAFQIVVRYPHVYLYI